MSRTRLKGVGLVFFIPYIFVYKRSCLFIDWYICRAFEKNCNCIFILIHHHSSFFTNYSPSQILSFTHKLDFVLIKPFLPLFQAKINNIHHYNNTHPQQYTPLVIEVRYILIFLTAAKCMKTWLVYTELMISQRQHRDDVFLKHEYFIGWRQANERRSFCAAIFGSVVVVPYYDIAP